MNHQTAHGHAASSTEASINERRNHVRNRNSMARPRAHRDHHLDRHRLLAGTGRGRKGHSFIGYFCLSLLFFPLSLLLAYLADDRTDTRVVM